MQGKLRGDEGHSFFGAVIASLVMVLVSVVVFAGQAEMKADKGGDDGKPKRTIKGKPENRRAVEALLEESEGDAEAEMSVRGDRVRELNGKFKIDKNKPVEEAAVDFIERHRNAFGLKDPIHELKLRDKEPSSDMSFQQVHNGVPVLSHSLGVHLDNNKDAYLIVNNTVPTPDIDTTPLVTEQEAVRIAKDYCISKRPDSRPGTSREYPVRLVIEDNHLAYIVTLFPLSRWWEVHVDAKTGKVLRMIDQTRFFTPEDMLTNGISGSGASLPIRLFNFNNEYYFAHSFPNITGMAISSSSFKMNNDTPQALNDKETFYSLGLDAICAFDAHTSIVGLGVDEENESQILKGNISFLKVGQCAPDIVVNGEGDTLTSGVNVLDNHDEVFRYFVGMFPDYFRNWHTSIRGVTRAAAIDEGYNTTLNRAFWNGLCIQYGPGDGSTRGDITLDRDIAAHEIGHVITRAKISDINATSQTGSIDEHYSDLWAIMVDADDWIICGFKFQVQQFRYS